MSTAFQDELEIFRKEEQTAQQLFFAWLAVRNLAASDREVVNMMNETPLYWTNTEYAKLLGAFVVLGRVFDQGSKHNVDRLIRIASEDLDVFSITSLRARKEAVKITPQQAAEYVEGKHALSPSDVRVLRKQITDYRRIYEARYRDVRDKVFAHKETAVQAEIDAMFAKTSIEEMKEIFGFLHSLHDEMWELLFNGRRPDVRPYKFVLPPDPTPGRSLAPGEIIFRDAQIVLKNMIPRRQA